MRKQKKKETYTVIGAVIYIDPYEASKLGYVAEFSDFTPLIY